VQQPVSQPIVQPIFNGQLRTLDFNEQKEVKKMLDLVNDCLQYNDTAGAINCCQQAITFMQTGKK